MHMILSIVSFKEYKLCELILELSLQGRFFFYWSGMTFVRVGRWKKKIYCQIYCCHINKHSFYERNRYSRR